MQIINSACMQIAEIAVEQHRAKGSNADERRVRMMYS